MCFFFKTPEKKFIKPKIKKRIKETKKKRFYIKK